MSSFYRRREMDEWEYGFWPLVRALSVRRQQRRPSAAANSNSTGRTGGRQSTCGDGGDGGDMLASVNVTLGRRLVRNWREHSRPEVGNTATSMTPPRRPGDLQSLAAATGFSRHQLQFFYRSFKQLCPNGLIGSEHFGNIYAQLFPFGGSSHYARLVFGVLDKTQCGQVSFEDFVHNLATLMNGTQRDRLCWVFSLYDVNNDGFISVDEMCAVVTAVYRLLGDNQDVADVASAKAHHLFKTIDRDNAGIITLAAFLSYCEQNRNIESCLVSYQKMWTT